MSFYTVTDRMLILLINYGLYHEWHIFQSFYAKVNCCMPDFSQYRLTSTTQHLEHCLSIFFSAAYSYELFSFFPRRTNTINKHLCLHTFFTCEDRKSTRLNSS